MLEKIALSESTSGCSDESKLLLPRELPEITRVRILRGSSEMLVVNSNISLSGVIPDGSGTQVLLTIALGRVTQNGIRIGAVTIEGDKPLPHEVVGTGCLLEVEHRTLPVVAAHSTN